MSVDHLRFSTAVGYHGDPELVAGSGLWDFLLSEEADTLGLRPSTAPKHRIEIFLRDAQEDLYQGRFNASGWVPRKTEAEVATFATEWAARYPLESWTTDDPWRWTPV